MSIPPVKSQLLQEFQRSLTPSARNPAMAAPPPAYTSQPINSQALVQIEDDHANADIDSPLSPINIKISNPITIIGDENVIAVDPAVMASSLASSVMQSIKDCSMARAGIPMIDEEGRPRPIDVQVDAEITVRGSRNTIGRKAVGYGLQTTRGMKRDREQREGEDEQQKAEVNSEEERDTEGSQKKQRVE